MSDHAESLDSIPAGVDPLTFVLEGLRDGRLTIGRVDPDRAWGVRRARGGSYSPAEPVETVEVRD